MSLLRASLLFAFGVPQQNTVTQLYFVVRIIFLRVTLLIIVLDLRDLCIQRPERLGAGWWPNPRPYTLRQATST